MYWWRSLIAALVLTVLWIGSGQVQAQDLLGSVFDRSGELPADISVVPGDAAEPNAFMPVLPYTFDHRFSRLEWVERDGKRLLKISFASLQGTTAIYRPLIYLRNTNTTQAYEVSLRVLPAIEVNRDARLHVSVFLGNDPTPIQVTSADGVRWEKTGTVLLPPGLEARPTLVPVTVVVNSSGNAKVGAGVILPVEIVTKPVGYSS